jgi:hypothetical protein
VKSFQIDERGSAAFSSYGFDDGGSDASLKLKNSQKAVDLYYKKFTVITYRYMLASLSLSVTLTDRSLIFYKTPL